MAEQLTGELQNQKELIQIPATGTSSLQEITFSRSFVLLKGKMGKTLVPTSRRTSRNK